MEGLKPVVIDLHTYEQALEILSKIQLYIGYDDFFKQLDEDFLTGPASTKHHSSVPHGLMYHSINVAIFTRNYLKYIRKNRLFDKVNNLSVEEFEQYLKEGTFAGLMHDLCKLNIYIPEEDLSDKQAKLIRDKLNSYGIDPNPFIDKLGKKSGSEFIDSLMKNQVEDIDSIKRIYSFNDTFNIGHGEKSVIMLLRMGVKLTDEQIIAIRYHMYSTDVLFNTNQAKSIQDFMADTPMLRALHLADLQSTFLFEK
jgi:hypothetical protein